MDDSTDSHRPYIPPIEELERLLIVGLGNPGERYAKTRHNAGFLVVDRLARREGIPLSQRRFDGLAGEGRLSEKRVILFKPMTYMNLSGRAVARAVRYLNLAAGALVVIHDDVDLTLGRIRVKWAGGSGGHKGLRSIDQELGHPEYYRVRIGVGRPSRGDVVAHVLSGFDADESMALEDIIQGGVDAVTLLCDRGLNVAQNCVNGALYWQGPS